MTSSLSFLPGKLYRIYNARKGRSSTFATVVPGTIDITLYGKKRACMLYKSKTRVIEPGSTVLYVGKFDIVSEVQFYNEHTNRGCTGPFDKEPPFFIHQDWHICLVDDTLFTISNNSAHEYLSLIDSTQ